jgi:HlyD family secretion protein
MKSRSSRLVRRAVLPVIIAIAIGFYFLHGRGGESRYITAEVSRGPILRSVIATGTVNPVTVVQIGCNVSGPIQAIYADFNASVKAGQLIAKIDPRPFQVKVDEAAAALANAKAQLGKDRADLAYKKLTYERNAALFKENAVSQDTRDSDKSAADQAVAQVNLDIANIEQQQANLRDAQVSLDYTNIISPVDGTVVSRNVDVGQTVAASFQTPTLFLVARDLTQMEVDANVSESDIGSVKDGTPANFTVDAFPGREFQGTVGQVRQAPITVQNVVTYDVVVMVANPELLLKPGMTANVTIVTAKRDNVLRVPVQAIRFSPLRMYPRQAEQEETGANPPVGQRARVWIVDDRGKLSPERIAVGLDDGNNIEVLSGDLESGDEVAIGENRPETAGAHGPLSPSMHFPH